VVVVLVMMMMIIFKMCSIPDSYVSLLYLGRVEHWLAMNLATDPTARISGFNRALKEYKQATRFLSFSLVRQLLILVYRPCSQSTS